MQAIRAAKAQEGRDKVAARETEYQANADALADMQVMLTGPLYLPVAHLVPVPHQPTDAFTLLVQANTAARTDDGD